MTTCICTFHRYPNGFLGGVHLERADDPNCPEHNPKETPVTDPMQQVVRDLAVVTACEQLLAKRKAELKAQFGAVRTTVYANTVPGDVLSDELGRVTVPKPRQPSPTIVDESQAIAWAVEKFGEGSVTVRLSDQGRADVIAAAKKGADVPGVEIPNPRPSSPAFTPAKNVVELVHQMFAAGSLTAADLPISLEAKA